jgi:3-oxoacyl-[acyl-carrier protein] reductase
VNTKYVVPHNSTATLFNATSSLTTVRAMPENQLTSPPEADIWTTQWNPATIQSQLHAWLVGYIAGITGMGSSVAYAASKGALNTMTLSLARSLAPAIRVNAVCPGFVETQLFEGLLQMVSTTRSTDREGARKYFTSQVPLGRMETGDDVANVVAFLASDDGNYMTGQALNICGGVEWH